MIKAAAITYASRDGLGVGSATVRVDVGADIVSNDISDVGGG